MPSLTYISNRSNNGKLNESIKYVCSSLVKWFLTEMIIERIVGKNNYNKWIRYGNILPSHKNTNLETSTIHLVGVDMLEIVN